MRVSDLSTIAELQAILQRHRSAFYLGSLPKSPRETILIKLRSLWVEGVPAEEAFNRCYVLRAENRQRDLKALIEEFGGGLGQVRAHGNSKPGLVFALVRASSARASLLSLPCQQELGTSLSACTSSAHPSSKKELRTNPSSCASSAGPIREEGLGTSSSSSACLPCKEGAVECGMQAVAEAKTAQVKEPLADPSTSVLGVDAGVGQADAAELESQRASDRPHKRIKQSDEAAPEPPPCRAFVATGGRREAQSSATAVELPDRRSQRAKEAALATAPIGHSAGADAGLASEEAFMGLDSLDSPEVAPEVIAIEEDDDELSEAEVDGLELDEWGFGLAMERLADSDAEPDDKVAVLQALLSSRPTGELLSSESWEAALQGLISSGPSSIRRQFTLDILDRWRGLRSSGTGEQSLETADFGAVVPVGSADLGAAQVHGEAAAALSTRAVRPGCLKHRAGTLDAEAEAQVYAAQIYSALAELHSRSRAWRASPQPGVITVD
mmetsp:Transcript_45076/g.97908  ORF Transcript_45076/g.97908 Transcript_45076/m.97908 type:complete len:498 (+) Transcript_45076:64-1557(+)